MGFFTAAAAIGAAALGAYSAHEAGQAQKNAAQQAAAGEAGRFAQQRADFAPYRMAGVGALNQYRRAVLEGDASAFQESPGYQFRLQQGEQAINRAAAARGQYFTPKTAMALQNYGQNLASLEYQNYLGNLTNLINVGSGSTANLSQLGAQSQARQGQYILGAGEAQANQALGMGRAIGGGLNNLVALNAYGG